MRLAALLLACFPALAAGPLPALDAERSATVSGLSAGGYMAVQLHVAHSASVKGAGVIAAGPYYCARGSLWSAYYNCMTPGFLTPLPQAAALRGEAERLAQAGRIDPTRNLAASRAWLFSGTRDRTVSREVVEALHAFYAAYQVATVLVGDKPAGHAMVTESAGNACEASAPPYINDCDYDAAGEMLRHLLGGLAPPASGGRLAAFDQSEFAAPGMAAEAFVYIPRACEKERCRVHVAFHGCRQAAGEFARHAGYNRWAEGNRLIVLYPQVAPSWWWPYNPRGCWDWWGYSGAYYHTREGAQIAAVKAMLERLSAPRR